MNTGPNKITGAMDLDPALFTDSNGHPVTCLVDYIMKIQGLLWLHRSYLEGGAADGASLIER